MRKLRTFIQISGKHRLLILEATFWLGVSRLAILTLPFRWITPHLGRHMAESPTNEFPEHRMTFKEVAWAIERMSIHLPWECKCLAQAMAGKRMLQARGLQSTLYLGVAKEEDDALIAHAWLRSGDIVVTGGPGETRYTVVSTFA